MKINGNDTGLIFDGTLRVVVADPNRAYKQLPMRSLEEISADILALEQETEEFLGEILGEAAK